MKKIKYYFSHLTSHVSHPKGFTLVELLIYMGVLSLLIGILSTMLGGIMDVQLDSQSTSGVDEDSRYVQARMAYDMQRASGIVTPTVGATGSSLQITINSVNYTYSLSGGNLQLNDGTTSEQLNSADTTVSGLSFQRIGDGDLNDTIRVTYTVTSDIQEVSGQETRTVQTTLGLQ